MKRAKAEVEKVIVKKKAPAVKKPAVAKDERKEPAILRWRKIGGGSLRILGQIIKPKQVFKATIDDIPEGFRNVVQCLDEEELKAEVKAGKIIFQNKEDLYIVEQVGKTELYNIVNKETKKALTKKPQTKEEAVILASSLNG